VMVQAWSTYLFPRLDSRDAAAGGQNLLMLLHRAIFTLVFFAANSMRAGSYHASKNSISVASRPSSPLSALQSQ